ncbi:hypothetical protein LB504_010043 [Fusarium proliferatum]|nr:hypothetical protein LB504_010043 [Fusarium proliferatum]
MQEALNRAERNIAADRLRPSDSGGVQETEDAIWQYYLPMQLQRHQAVALIFWQQHSRGTRRFPRLIWRYQPRAGASSQHSQWQPCLRQQQDRTDGLIDITSKLLLTRSGHTVLAWRCCQYNTLRFLYRQSREALFRRAALQAEDKVNSDWDDEAGSSQKDKEGEGKTNNNGDDKRALYGRKSKEK